MHVRYQTVLTQNERRHFNKTSYSIVMQVLEVGTNKRSGSFGEQISSPPLIKNNKGDDEGFCFYLLQGALSYPNPNPKGLF